MEWPPSKYALRSVRFEDMPDQYKGARDAQTPPGLPFGSAPHTCVAGADIKAGERIVIGADGLLYPVIVNATTNDDPTADDPTFGKR